MNTRFVSASSALAILGLANLPVAAICQQKTVTDQLGGTWTLLIDDTVGSDGTQTPLFGPNPNGVVSFDDTGHYKLEISRSSSPQPASGPGTSGASGIKTAAVVSHSGTYKADEAAHELTLRAEKSPTPNSEQKWKFSILSADDLKWEAPRNSGDGSELIYWRRAK